MAAPQMPSRRTFLRRAAGTAGLSLIPASLAGLVSAGSAAGEAVAGKVLGHARAGEGGYGPLVRESGPLVVPEGFQVRVISRIGDPMADGRPTPLAHDGMAAFAQGSGGNARLVRNQEVRNPAGSGHLGGRPYDEMAGGGCTTLEIGADRTLVRDWISIGGTLTNCAGGPTPWGSWLTCEETVAGPNEGFGKQHGYVFEVPASADEAVEAVPIKAMGRFSHEAVAVDPATGHVYLTEDNNYVPDDPVRPGSGFYRFIPNNTSGRVGSLLEGGTLQMLKVKGTSFRLLFTGGIAIGEALDVEWVDIADPDPFDDDAGTVYGERMTAVFNQGRAQGASAFRRLEGCWYGDGSIFFNDTAGGRAACGEVWQYVPDREQLVLVFESPGVEVLQAPDNLCVSPRGGLVLCEDGGGEQFVRGLTQDGRIFDLAKNIISDDEFAGACFSPDGRTLFVNIQGNTSGTPAEGAGTGMTLAIWGPWEKGAI